MALIIEDGTGVDNSNTYVDDTEYVAYASSRGLTIGGDATAREQELIMSVDFLESFRAKLKGVKSDGTNSLQYPRIGVYIDNVLNASDNIPTELKRAQMEAAAYQSASQLTSNTVDKNIQSEKLSGLEVSYFYGGKSGSQELDRINVWLKPLLKVSASGSILTRV